MASDNDMPRFMFDTENLYEDLVKAHIRIHELNQARPYNVTLKLLQNFDNYL